MRTLPVLLLLLSHGVAQAAGVSRYIYRLPPEKISAAEFTPMNFGLSEEQKEAIYSLTSGKVDFRHFYSHAGPPLNEKKWQPYLNDVLASDVAPPFILTADPQLDQTWWYKKLNLAEAWSLSTGKGVVLADCDAGYATRARDLSPNLWMEHAFDFADRDQPLMVNDGAYQFHGTAVAAIMIGAKDDQGTNGIAFDAKLVPLQNYNYNESDDVDKEEATAQCILHAIKIPEVKIVVLENQTETGSSETFEGTRAAVRLALMAGVTIVSAAGNYEKELLAEAKDDTGSIIVGALNTLGAAIYFTNYGARVTVAAYGEKLSTLYTEDGRLEEFGGTSGATPQVAGTVALMLEANPALTPVQVKEILIQTRKRNAQNEKVGGLVDVVEAVKRAALTPPISLFKESVEFRRRLSEIL